MISVTLPWPPAILSPNRRTRSYRWKASETKKYRHACAEAAWQRGVTPAASLRLTRIVFHPPDERRRDLDNVIASFKAGQDGLAEAMATDDTTFNTATRDFGQPVKGGAVVVMLEGIPGT